MPIQLISANLNQLGDSGNFETDPSTWGGSHFDNVPGDFTISRSNAESTKGSNSCKVDANHSLGVWDSQILAKGTFNIASNKKYVFYANVKTPSGAAFANDNCFVSFDLQGISGITVISSTTRTIASIRGNWLQVAYQFSTDNSFSPSPYTSALYIKRTSGSGNEVNLGNSLYIDQFEIYEYVDVTSGLDFTATTTDDYSGSPLGSITVNATGGIGPYEYSNGGPGGTSPGSWQSSNVLSGLIGGYTYSIFVRDASPYTVNKPVVVNMAAPPVSFTTTVTNESVVNAHDGKIVVNASGSNTPFQYSKDSGATWQSGNIFAGLAPGDYSIYVKDSTDFLMGAVVTVSPGLIAFEKIWWSRNPIIYPAAANTGWQSLTNVRIYNDVTVDDDWSGTYVSKMKVDQPVDANGSVIFYNRQAIEKTLKANPPDKVNPNPVKLTDRIKLFRNNTAQLSGTETTPSSSTPSLPHLVLLGGLSKYQWAKLEESTPFFTGYLPLKKIFMTWAPVVKPVDKNQEDYLNYFVALNTVATLKRNLKIFYDDGTNETKVDVLINGSVRYGDLYELRTGPIGSGAVAYAQAAGKNLIKYEYSLLNQANASVSETRTYVLDAVSHPRKRLFMFLNSLGSYEVLRFTGAAERQAVIAKNEIVKFLPYGYNSLDGERETNSVAIRESDNFSTGYFNDQYGKAWQDYMKDLLISRRVFDVTDGRRIPVMIQPATYPMGADQNYEYYVRFVGADAYEDESYTPKDLP